MQKIVESERNEQGLPVYTLWDDGFWVRRIYDNAGRKLYLENSHGYWEKQEFDEKGVRTYYENSIGTVQGVSRGSPEEDAKEAPHRRGSRL